MQEWTWPGRAVGERTQLTCRRRARRSRAHLFPLRAVDDGAFSCRISKWTEFSIALVAFLCIQFTSQPEAAASLDGYKRRGTCPSNVILKQEASTSTQLTLLLASALTILTLLIFSTFLDTKCFSKLPSLLLSQLFSALPSPFPLLLSEGKSSTRNDRFQQLSLY